MKTVNLADKPTLMIKFTFQANYVNTHNVFNQIGVISLCIFGESMMGNQEPQKGLPTSKGMPTSLKDFDKLDKTTMAKLKDLEVQKKMAIDEEDFDRAQKIK